MWTIGVVAALLLSGLVGFSLGLVGGGGSILTVPILVYVAGLPAKEAVALSLAIVGATAAVGAVVQYRAGDADLRIAGLFGGTGMLGAFLGAPLTRLVPAHVLMLIFAALMVLVGVRMLAQRGAETAPEETMSRPRAAQQALRCGVAGLGVGILTGFLGVGGGFLIVPALLRFARIPMRKAVGTSLVVIALNSAAGYLAHRGEAVHAGPMALVFTVAAVGGLAGGLVAGRRMRPAGLRAAFGALALAVAAFLVLMNIRPALGF